MANEIDKGVDDARGAIDGEPSRPGDRQERVRDLQGNFGDRPAEPGWPVDGLRLGMTGKGFVFTGDSMESTMPDASNPGMSFNAETGGELRAGGQKIETDVGVEHVAFGDQVFNPRIKYGPMNIVNHYPPMLTRVPSWVKSAMAVVKPMLAVISELEKLENA